MSQYFLYPRTTLMQILLYLLYTHILGQRAKRTILAIADLAKNNKMAALLVFMIFHRCWISEGSGSRSSKIVKPVIWM